MKKRNLFFGLVVFLFSCENNEVVIKNSKEEPLSQLKQLTVTQIQNFLSDNIVDSNIKEPLYYAFYESISDSSIVFIGSDFNHVLLSNPKYYLIDILVINNKTFILYSKSSFFKEYNKGVKDSLFNKLINYNGNFAYHDLKAWKIVFADDGIVVDKTFDSVTHIKEKKEFNPPDFN